MGTLFYRRNLYLALLIVSVLIMAACTPNPRAQLISPDMVPEGAGEEFVRPTPTPVPNIADLSSEQILAGLDGDILAAFPGDPEAGQQLTVANGCIGCHNVDPSVQGAGPTWYNMANTAIIRDPAQGPAAYIHQSIVNPNSYLVPGYAANIMPQVYGETLTAEQLADIVSYLLTLQGEVE